MVVAWAMLSGAPDALTASATWNGTTNSNWGTNTNWNGNNIPGTGDTATFSNAGNGNTTLNLGTGVTVNTVLFTTSSAAAYTIGSGGVNNQMLTLNFSGAITVNSTVTNNQLINATLRLGTDGTSTGSFTFTNDSSSANLTIAGNVSEFTTNGANPARTLNLAGSGNGTINGVINGNGNGSGSNAQPLVSLVKSGTGTWTLSGANTYAGTTTVNAGTLLVNGSLASGSVVTVNNSGSVLGGTGTINGAVTINSGAAILGGIGSTGQTLTLANNLTLGSSSIIELALGAAGAHSTIARTGGTWSFQTAQQFAIVDLGATTGTYSNIITGLASDPGTSSWTILNGSGTFTYSGGNISLTLTAVPEPGTYSVGALSLGALLIHQRRRLRALLCKFA